MKYVNLKSREGRHTFYSSPEWRSMREIVLTTSPWCKECERNGKPYVLATEVHHKVDIVDDPSRCMDIENLEGLCKPCHSRITSREKSVWRPVLLVPAHKKWNLSTTSGKSPKK